MTTSDDRGRWQLTVKRDHLDGNRRMIIGRSLVASVAGAVPVPGLDDYLSSAIRRRTMRRIAEAHGVDLDDAAVRAIADGPQRPPEWAEIAGGALAYRLLARQWRKLIVTYVAVRRSQVAARNFTIATLFDHYCAKLHVGVGLDGPDAAELRALMTEAIEQTPGGLGNRLFRRGVTAAARATIKAPLEAIDLLSRGRLRKLLTRGDEVEAIAEVDNMIDQQLADQKGFLARSTKAIELQMSAGVNPYLEDLIIRFEKMWRDRRES